MELLHQIFPPWHIYLDVFLLGVGSYIYLRITKKKSQINETLTIHTTSFTSFPTVINSEQNIFLGSSLFNE